jgi:NitT/TauT family transport system substrate-binding protein
MLPALRRFAFFLIAVALAAIAVTPVAEADDSGHQKLVTVTFGGPSAGYWNAYLANELGLYQKHGIDPKFYWFTSGAPLLAGLKSGSIDVVVTGLATVFALGQHIPLKIIFWELDHSQGEGLMVTASSGIKSYKDIAKAKAIGVQPGTCSQVALGLIAQKAGIQYSQLNTINLAPPLFANAFTGKSIDAATGWGPWTFLQPPDVKVVSWDPEYGGVCPSVEGIRPDFIKAHPDIGLKLLQVNQEARKLVEQNPKLAVNALQRYLKIPESAAKQFYERHCCNKLPTVAEQLDPQNPYSMVAKRGGLAKQLYIAAEVLHETGTIPVALTWEQIDDAVDPSVLRQYQAVGNH